LRLSVAMITYNEEKKLGKTLESVKALADEIIIVDSHSSDKTVEIAKKYGAKVYDEDWKGFGAQKNSALDKCQGDWVLMIDADEVVSEKLAEKIQQIVSGTRDNIVYKINRNSVCFGKEIRHGGWSKQYAIRLVRRDSGRWNENKVHEQFIHKQKEKKIKEKILHYSYLDLEEYLAKFNKYTSLSALQNYKNRKNANVLNIIFSPGFKFIKMYIIKLGFLDGIEGFLLASLSATYNMAKYYKLRQMYNEDKNKR